MERCRGPGVSLTALDQGLVTRSLGIKDLFYAGCLGLVLLEHGDRRIYVDLDTHRMIS